MFFKDQGHNKFWQQIQGQFLALKDVWQPQTCLIPFNWCKFKRLTPFQIVKFCWILYAEWNICQINFNCVFVFALAILNSYINFFVGNTIGILTADISLLGADALSCLCIPLSNAVVEWVFNHATSVFKMWKSCDFECV